MYGRRAEGSFLDFRAVLEGCDRLGAAADLRRSVKERDVESFARLIAAHERKVYGLAYRLMGNEEDAKDLAQEAFLRAFTSLERFRGNSAFSTWLYRIVVNVCIDEMRKRKRERTRSLSEKPHLDESEPASGASLKERDIADSSPGPAEQLESKELSDVVRKAIDELSEHYRTAIILRDIEGFSYEEIAAITGCSLGTVKSRLNRARNALREAIRSRPDFACHLSQELLKIRRV